MINKKQLLELNVTDIIQKVNYINKKGEEE